MFRPQLKYSLFTEALDALKKGACKKRALEAETSTSTKKSKGSTLSIVSKPQVSNVAATTANQPALDFATIDKIQECANILIAQRCNRVSSKDLATPDQICEFKILDSHELHSASMPGILALDVCSFNDHKILTGGNDKNATVFNKDTQKIVSILKGHSKMVTKVIYHPECREEWETVITASLDTTIRVWNVSS